MNDYLIKQYQYSSWFLLEADIWIKKEQISTKWYSGGIMVVNL